MWIDLCLVHSLFAACFFVCFHLAAVSQRLAHCSLFFVLCWMLDVGCWILDFGCYILVLLILIRFYPLKFKFWENKIFLINFIQPLHFHFHFHIHFSFLQFSFENNFAFQKNIFIFHEVDFTPILYSIQLKSYVLNRY